MRSTWTLGGYVAVALILAAVRPGSGQTAKRAADWPMYRRDTAGTGYSPLTQIDATNVAKLTGAWTYGLQGDAPPSAGRGPAGPNSEATPIVVGGVMYLTAVGRVVALDPQTGKELWRHAITGGQPSRRGVAYWPGYGSNGPRIIVAVGRRLVALDAKTGAPVHAFGKDGEIDLVVPFNSVPLIYKNVIVIGANSSPNGVRTPGNARAFDARTGAKLWEFSTVAQPGMVGNDTWEGESWKGRAGANAWPFYFTVDEHRGLVFIPTGAPDEGEYGGDRKGANLYANSVIAVDILTGKYKWHFQTIHHDLWDADPPSPPTLVDIRRNNRTIPAAIVTTKSGYMYILNRETGQPVFGVEERAVPKSDVPGEAAFPTQPFPVKPAPIARNSFSPTDLVTADDTTPEHAQACKELVDKIGGVYNAGPFTPWLYRPEGAPVKSTLVFPGTLGGANWGGVAYDQHSGNVYVATQNVGAIGWLEKSKDGGTSPYDKVMPERSGPGRGTFDVRIGDTTLPCQRPPWGQLLAINPATGDVSWTVRLGVTDSLPAGKQNTGRPVLAGPITTASGLLFIGSTDDNRFRALDAKTGKELWVTRLDRRGNANPITYQARNGKQYVAIVATDTLSVFALP
jgi:glucose dehydrogenase